MKWTRSRERSPRRDLSFLEWGSYTREVSIAASSSLFSRSTFFFLLLPSVSPGCSGWASLPCSGTRLFHSSSLYITVDLYHWKARRTAQLWSVSFHQKSEFFLSQEALLLVKRHRVSYSSSLPLSRHLRSLSVYLMYRGRRFLSSPFFFFFSSSLHPFAGSNQLLCWLLSSTWNLIDFASFAHTAWEDSFLPESWEGVNERKKES